MDVQPPLIWLVIVGLGAACVLLFPCLLAWGLWRAFRRKPESTPARVSKRVIDVAALDASGAPDSGPQLEYYGCPVRLAILVLAPVGRDGVPLKKEQLPGLLDQFVPQFLSVVASHQPQLYFWPGQVSAAGFSNAFFGQFVFPGERGKGTPWCGLTGRFAAQGGHYLAGLVCCGETALGLGQLVIEQEGQWHDVLRVKK